MGISSVGVNPTWGPLYGKGTLLSSDGDTGPLAHACNGIFILGGTSLTIYDCDGDSHAISPTNDIVLPMRATRVQVTTGTALVMW